MIRIALLPIIGIAPVLEYVFRFGSVWVFVSGLAGIAVLAEWIRFCASQLAMRVGPAIGGLLTVTLGSLAELLLAISVLLRGHIDVVHAQITGSILATSLLGLGMAILIGGLAREQQHFRKERANLLSSLLILSVIALLLPAVSDYTRRSITHSDDIAAGDEVLSVAVSGVLLFIYVANLFYTLVTHRDIFGGSEKISTGEQGWAIWQSLLVLALATAAAAAESELVSGALQDVATALDLSPLFLGVIVLALVSTVADVFAAVWFARKDRMDLAISICIGSSIQVALVVAPLLVVLSWLIGSPMTLVFRNPLELFVIAGATFAVSAIASDGETTWFEGVLLIGVYILFGTAFYVE